MTSLDLIVSFFPLAIGLGSIAAAIWFVLYVVKKAKE